MSRVKRKRGNYYTPLQVFDNDDDDLDLEEESAETVGANNKIREFIPPLKVIGQTAEFIHSMLEKKGIANYKVQRMSIGVKVLCENVASYEVIKVLLKENKCQYFTHDKKSDRCFKTVLFGLEGKTEAELKNELIRRGLKCVNIKRVDKKHHEFTDTIYIASFLNGSLKLRDLRRDHNTLFRTIVRWEFQKRIKNKVVQCRNCQMFGHGERGCSIITKCAHCAGKHRTDECQSISKVKCANCNGRHKAFDNSCPMREKFLEIKSNFHNKAHDKKCSKIPDNNFSYKESDFLPLKRSFRSQPPLVIAENNTPKRPQYSEALRGNNLFSEQEISQLTLEMISRLRSCTSREEQFNVITQLTIKYLYSYTGK